MKCAKCGMPILAHMKFMKNDKTGEVYCIDCFEKLMGVEIPSKVHED